MAESLAAGAVVAAVAQRHDVHPNLLHHWRRQSKLAGGVGQWQGFLPVTVDEAALGRVLRALGTAGR